MNKWLLISFSIIVIPLVIFYMWIRHPIKSWREVKNSWNFVVNGKDDDRGLY